MYKNLPNLIMGFHGCDTVTYEKVLYRHEKLMASHNAYDWLGNGVYRGDGKRHSPSDAQSRAG